MTQIQQLKQQHSLASWKQTILAQQNSGLTAAEYCRQQNIAASRILSTMPFTIGNAKFAKILRQLHSRSPQRMRLLLNLLRWQPLPLRPQFKPQHSHLC